MPRMDVDSPGLEVLARDECMRLLSGAVIGRVVFTASALPAIQPVNFVLDGDGSVVIRTAPGSRLASAARNAVVAFEVDDFDAATHAGWSVIVTGRANLVRDEGDLHRLADLPLHPWAGGHRTEYIRVAPEIVSGRRVAAAAAAEPLAG
jgi:nitroimidazol reductase NimA-like FMN-containing flavoprotein (pyridoxamine 5'-phosphate oxidase superfamily)